MAEKSNYTSGICHDGVIVAHPNAPTMIARYQKGKWSLEEIPKKGVPKTPSKSELETL